MFFLVCVVFVVMWFDEGFEIVFFIVIGDFVVWFDVFDCFDVDFVL